MKRLLACGLLVAVAATVVYSQATVSVQIDVAANRHPIDARVYGVASADAASLADLRIPIHRLGGNPTTRYNWQVNASNRASDWYFESIANGGAVPGALADTFVSQSKANGAQSLLTIPMAGWVAKVGPTRNNLASFSIAKYGAQTGSDAQFFPDAGNGILAATSQPITGNDPNDADVSSNAAFQLGWVQHLVSTWGTSANGGVRYYALDNEPSIWHVTHRDIHPAGATMDEVFNDAVTYATQIKAVDPGALVLGPEEWGWSGYFYSGADQQYGAAHGWSSLPDRIAHGNMDYLPWYLNQIHERDLAAGQRLLDIFSVHFYPQGGQYSNDTSTAMQQLRNRSTRALWDPSYVDESWIGTQVELIPRLKGWVATYYPGTQVGLTEYNWGAEGHINGATTLADILGIFGREGLDVATYWTTPAASSPTYNAIKMYRNYDSQGSAFGDTSVSAAVPNPDLISVFAAQRTTDGALTVMAINKDLSNTTAVNFQLANFATSGPVQAWQLTASNTITRLADASVSSSTLAATLPSQSITLFVLPLSSGSVIVPGAPMDLRILSSATVSGATTSTAVTTTSGGATAPTLTANGTTGVYAVTAAAPGASTAGNFSLTNTLASGGGVWTNVTPGGIDLTNALDCGNFGTTTMVSDPARPSNLYTQFNCQGVWKSTDYGQTWTGPINTGARGSGASGAGGLAVAQGPSGQPPILYSAGIRGTGTGFWKSIDGGVSWTNYNVAPGDSRQDFYPPVVDPYNTNHLVMNGHEMNLIVQSVDGGQSWAAVPMAGGMNENGGTGFLSFINTGNAATTARTWIWTAQGTGGTIGTWRTADGGGSWTRVDSNEHPHGEMQIYQPDASGVVYMAGIYSASGWGVLRSTDFGQTWTHVGLTSGEAVVFGTPNSIYATYAWACSGCTIDPAAEIAPSPGVTGWTSVPTASGMAMGPAQTATVFDGAHYVIVTANWLSGLWRYVE